MSPAFIRGVANHLPQARITFDKFHVVAHASAALDQTRRLEQRHDPSLKGLRWTLLRDRHRLSAEARTDLDALIAHAATKRTARAWLYREGLRAILDRKQINVVAAMLKQWCTNVLRSKVAPMKDVARMIRRHFEGIVAWTQLVKPMASSRPSMASSRRPNAKPAAIPALPPCAPCSFSLPASSTSPPSTLTPLTHSKFNRAQNMDVHMRDALQAIADRKVADIPTASVNA
jgi:transposase